MQRYLFLLLIPVGSLAQDIGGFKKAQPFALHGSLSADVNDYTQFHRGKDTASLPNFGSNFAYFFQASPVISIYGYATPISLLLTSQSKSFSYPVYNRFGLSPSYKWIKLHLGWRSLQFSQFTLSGQQMFGAGFELTPGKWKAAFMYGKFNNAVTDISTYNNLNNNAPLYKRTGWVAKLGYGGSRNFIELSYLQAKDDSNSIAKTVLDTTSVRPAANQVAGLLGQLTLHKGLVLRAELAASYYTRNVASDTFNADSYWTKLAYFPVKTSSRVAFAQDISLSYRLKAGSVQAQYRRIDPDYQSMGAYYMQTDMEQYTFGFNYSFLKGRLHLQSNIGLQRNDLANTATDNTHRTIGNVALSIAPSNSWGIDVNYSNYGISQQIIPQLTNPATIIRYDSVRISEINQSIAVSPHLFINGSRVQHSFTLQASFQLLSNENGADSSQANQNLRSSMSSLIYSILLRGSSLTITNMVNYFNTVMTGQKTATLGYNLGISKGLFQAARSEGQKRWLRSVTVALFGGYFRNSAGGSTTGSTVSLNPSVSLGFAYKQSLQFTGNYTSMQNSTTGPSVAGGSQLMVSARYNVNF